VTSSPAPPDRMAATFAVEAVTRRQPYPGAEVATERAYFLAGAR
jgi:hypothetical protein